MFLLERHTAGPLRLRGAGSGTEKEGGRSSAASPHGRTIDTFFFLPLQIPSSAGPLTSPVMSGWISSKLKVAESFLQQIDQQAAESLGKGERAPSPPPPGDDDEGALKKKAESLPLKLQLQQKPQERTHPRDGGPRPKGNPNSARNPPARALGLPDDSRTSASSLSPPVVSDSDAAAALDGDWTKLLSSPISVSPVAGGSGGSSPPPRSKKKVGAPKRRSNNLSGREVETSRAGTSEVDMPSARHDGVDPIARKRSGSLVLSEVSIESSVSSNSRQSGSLVESASDTTLLIAEPRNDMGDRSLFEANAVVTSSEARKREGSSAPKDDGHTRNDVTVPKGRSNADNAEVPDVEDRRGSTRTLQTSHPRLLPKISTRSSGSSGSDSDSTSTSDSEYESERKMERRQRRERILAEKAAAMAAEAIKERENLVARLEGEKESLEKVLEERQKQQAQEATELQTSMMEAMEAVDLEKQKHNSTRMEALACLAQLETRNAELARSLATTQWDLEVEVNQLMNLRDLIESKELVQEDLRKKISSIHQNAVSSNHMEASKGEYERKIVEAELSFICDKVAQLKEKAVSLERNIEMTKELMHPTEIEIELKKRLKQLTDTLIQKQAQVETLSSEKATLLFRIETISRLLEENGMPLNPGSTGYSGLSSAGSSARIDIEAAMGEPSYSTFRPLFREKVNSGGQQLGSFLQQLDAIFAAGSMLLRKNQVAQLWALVYLVCLHLWVLYILMSHSQTSDVTGSGAVFSLENINKTSP